MLETKHIEWFRQGAGTLRALARERGREDYAFPDSRDWYLCPLCIDTWLTDAEFGTGWLTVEHVPRRRSAAAN